MAKISDSLDKFLVEKGQKNDRDETYFHPSEFGDCPAKIWLKLKGRTPDVHEGSTGIMIFDNGHFLHLRYQLYFRDAGMAAQDEVVSVSQQNISIGLKHKDVIMAVGKSGREYPYDPEEKVWMVTEPDDTRRKIAGMEEPVTKNGCDLVVGDKVWMVEVPLLDREYHFGGHADLIAYDDGVETVVDFKSKGEFRYSDLWYDYDNRDMYESRITDPHLQFCHICGETMEKAKDLVPHLMAEHMDWLKTDKVQKIQLHIYMWLLGLQKGILLHENKGRQFVVFQEVKRDDELIEKIKKNAQILWKMVEERKTPPIPSEYGSRKSFPCKYCKFVSRCWS